MSVLADWKEFPKIGLITEGKKEFYSLQQAIPLWDSGVLRVEDSGEVLEQNFCVRQMTREENRAFQDRVDEYSAGK
jgi:hypothetical protein